jgi:hypothetical protein
MITRSSLWIVAAVAAVVSLAACAAGVTTSSVAVSQIVSTTSFGMCQGYCSTRLEISAGQAVLIREPGGRGPRTLPTQRFTATLTPIEWEEISRLAAGTDLSHLPPVIGCPDCADGGAESLTIARGGETRSVSFDHGATVEPAQLLLERVRALRTRLTPRE